MFLRILLTLVLSFVLCTSSSVAWETREYAPVQIGPHGSFTVTNTDTMSAAARAETIRERIQEVLETNDLDPNSIMVRTSMDGTPVISVGPVVIAAVTDDDATAFGQNKQDIAQEWLRVIKPRIIQMKPLFEKKPTEKKHAGELSDRRVLLLVLEVGILLLASLVLGEIVALFGQPAIIGQILAGVILGQTVLGSLLPDVSAALFPVDDIQLKLLQALSWIGVLFLIMLTGMETDLQLIKQMGKPALYITWIGLAIPLLVGIGTGYLMPAELLADQNKRLAFAVFLGTCFCVSSVPVVAKVLMDMKVLKSRCGQLALASSLSHDLMSCLLFALIAALASGNDLGPGRLLTAPLGAVAFIALVFICRRPVYTLLRWINAKLKSDESLLTGMVVLLMAGAAITHLIGAHTVLGAFVVGVLIWQAPVVNERAIKPIKAMTMGVLAPIFFASSCLYVDLTTLLEPKLAITAAIICVLGIGSKVLACWIAGKMSGLSNFEGIAAGIAADTRGSMGLIVSMLGYSLGLITLDMVAIIVFLSLISTALAPTGLRWAISKIPVSGEELLHNKQQTRIARTMLGDIRRILVLSRGQGRTILAMKFFNSLGRGQTMEIAVLEHVSAEADSVVKLSKHVDSRAVSFVQVVPETDDLVQEVVQTARHGYDLIVLGTDKPTDGPGLFGQTIDDVCRGSRVPVLIISDGPTDASFSVKKILLPVGGTTESLTAAELGIGMASAFGASVVCLHINAAALTTESDLEPSSLSMPTMGITDAVTESLAELAAAMNVEFRRAAPELAPRIADSILATAHREQADLIVLGGTPRVSDHLVLGETIATVARKAPCAVAVLKF
ncbi:MAG: cation:proton antiporter [Candidatus Obscuribacterales bacterium]|nr:cation:proton antiporter [Candidatus Obscuribacterales bacterium]